MLTARRKVVEEVRTAYQTLLASTSNLRRIREQLIPLQERRRSISDGAYRAGEADVTVLFLAEQDLRLAQTQAIEVELQSSNALVRLQRAVGGAAAARTLTSASTATNIENTNASQLTSIEKVTP
jgi:outer membrane protein TolC